jgi:hypothetical protein
VDQAPLVYFQLIEPGYEPISTVTSRLVFQWLNGLLARRLDRARNRQTLYVSSTAQQAGQARLVSARAP